MNPTIIILVSKVTFCNNLIVSYSRCIFLFIENIELLIKTAATKTAKNCDVFYEIGYSTDGVFGILTGDSSVQAFCEFDQEGYNWMVSEYLAKQNQTNKTDLG